MKLTRARSCTLRKQASRGILPSRNPSRNKNSLRPMIKSVQFSNIQRRRFSGFFEVKIDDSCETIGELKKCISLQKNLAIIALLYRGVKLEDKRRLDNFLPDLHIGPPRFSVHTRVRPRAISGGISLNVLNFNRKTFQVHFPSLDSTILELKKAIHGYDGISCDMIALIYEGRQLNADDSTLRECKLEPGCTVHLGGRLRGGHPKLEIPEPELLKQVDGMNFVDVENTECIQKIPLNSNAPVWRISKRGLNIEGKCRNRTCSAFGEMVVCNLHFTAFNLAEEVHCPLCKFTFKAKTCGFRKCTWMFEGRKIGIGSVDVMSQWMVAGKHYERFNEASGRNTSRWKSLIITAKEIQDGNKDGHGNEDQCAICFESFSSASFSQHVAVCGHVFHINCVTAWELLGNTRCPTCRDPL